MTLRNYKVMSDTRFHKECTKDCTGGTLVQPIAREHVIDM